mgnify:CR=1 FL=1
MILFEVTVCDLRMSNTDCRLEVAICDFKNGLEDSMAKDNSELIDRKFRCKG